MARTTSDAGWLTQDLLDAIYDSAFDRKSFDELGEVLARATNSSNAVLILRQGYEVLDLTANISPDAQKAYQDHYWKLDPWTPAVFQVAPFTVVASADNISDAQLSRSEFYTDYAAKFAMYQPFGIRADVTPDVMVTIGLNRPSAKARYDESERSDFVQVAHHVQRALQLRERLQIAQRGAAASHGALDALSFGVVIADADGRIRFANSAAEDLSRRGAGIRLAAGRLRSSLLIDGAILAALVRDAAAGGAGGSVRLRDADGAVSILTIVAPLPSRLSETGIGEGLALVAVRPAGDSPQYIGAMLTGLFKLSQAESQICMHLLGGESLEEVAQRRGVKITTLKTQLESIFHKTGVDSQRDLLRLLGAIPPIRGFGDRRN